MTITETDRLNAEITQWQQIAGQGIRIERALREENMRLRAHLKWFCDRVDAGEVRSKKTYERFKKELANGV